VPSRRTLLLAGLAGGVVGIGLAAVLVVAGVLERSPGSVDASPAFLGAYERSRRATFAMDAAFSRTMPDGRRLESAAFVAQRPPDSIRRQLGGVRGVVGGRRLNCSTAAGGDHCGPGGPAPPFEEAIVRELAILRSYFAGEAPLYAVRAAGDGCFELDQRRAVIEPPYGERAVMCFDPSTGAMRALEVRHPGGVTDRLEAVTIRTEVSDADFTTTRDGAYDPTIVPTS